MPNLETHKSISLKRTKSKDDFSGLHKWMDEATDYLGHDHRLERHFYTEEYKNYIKKKWGEKAIVEWLFHIAIDNLETANKFASDIYFSNYDEITIFFDGKEINSCDFCKNSTKSKRTVRWSKK